MHIVPEFMICNSIYNTKMYNKAGRVDNQPILCMRRLHLSTKALVS